MADRTPQQIFDEDWRDIVMKGNQVDVDQLILELADYSTLLHEVPLVYCEITGHRLSKPHYPAATVIRVYEECQERLLAEDPRIKFVTTLTSLLADGAPADEVYAQTVAAYLNGELDG